VPEQHVEGLGLLVGVLAAREERVVRRAAEALLDALEHAAVERVRDALGQDADGQRVPARQLLRHDVGPVAERFHRRHDGDALGARHRHRLVEHA